MANPVEGQFQCSLTVGLDISLGRLPNPDSNRIPPGTTGMRNISARTIEKQGVGEGDYVRTFTISRELMIIMKHNDGIKIRKAKGDMVFRILG